MTIAVLLAVSDAGSHLWALFVFGFAAFTLVALLGEFWRAGSTRHALTGEAYPRALATAVGRNRRRYGGYIVHAGIALTLIGIAASSSFQTNRDLRLQVGQTAKVGDYTIAYRKLTADPAERADRLRRAARRHPRRQALRHAGPGAQLLPDAGPDGGAIGRYFMGESTSEVGLKTGAGGDLWTAFQPDLSVLNPAIIRGNHQLADLPPVAQGIAILALAQHYAQASAAGQLPGDRQPAGGLDLDRRPDRGGGCGDGGLAGPRVTPPAGGRLPGQARQGAGDGEPAITGALRPLRLGAPPLKSCSLGPCSSSSSQSPSSCWSPGS